MAPKRAREPEVEPPVEKRVKTKRPKVQAYDPDGFDLVHTCSNFVDGVRWLAGREGALVKPASDQGIKQAVERRTVYHGFRWATLDRDEPNDSVQSLEPTAEAQQCTTELIAMLDWNQTEVLKVFPDQLSASYDRHLNASAISRAITNQSMCCGRYFRTWRNVEPAMQQAYLARAELPTMIPPTASRAVERLPPAGQGGDKKVYPSLQAAVTDVARATRDPLLRAIEDGTVYKGFTWRFV